MKIVLLLSAIWILLSACKKGDFAPASINETAGKIMGKWMVKRTIIESINTPPLLNSKMVVLGAAGEYFDFEANELVAVKTAHSAAKFQQYHVWNPSHVMIGEVGWSIENFTTTDLELKLERINGTGHNRYITKFYLSRKN